MKKKRLVQKVIEYILKKTPEELSILTAKSIADHFTVSLPHLSRTFKDEMGVNLKKFIIREKILAMRFLLIQNKKISIKNLALSFNFCSSDHFINLFKENTGMTPYQFRKIYKGFYGLEDRRQGIPEKSSSDERVTPERRNKTNYSRNK